MKIITVNINQVALKDPQKICLLNDDFYKKCSRYLGFLTKEVAVFFQSQGFRQVSTESSMTKATFLFNHQKNWWKITNVLPQEMVKNSISFFTVEVSDEKVVDVQALFKKLKIPIQAIA